MSSTGRQMGVLIGVFIACLVGLIFLPEVAQLCSNAQSNETIANGSAIVVSIVGFIPVFYALLLLGAMAGALWRMFG